MGSGEERMVGFLAAELAGTRQDRTGARVAIYRWGLKLKIPSKPSGTLSIYDPAPIRFARFFE